MNKKRLVIAFSGPSNSGKTTAIVKVTNILQAKGFKVGIIKHDPKDKASFDKKGKDSYKFGKTGANVAVVSPKRTSFFKNESLSIDELVELFGNFDYLLIEGLKTLEIARISIFRDFLDESYFKVTQAIACDASINKEQIPSNIDILDLNNPLELITWIDLNAKRV